MQVSRLIRVGQVRGVDVYFHWTLFVIVALLVAGAKRQPATSIAGLASYLGLLTIHECGHIVAARWKGYEAYSISLYPICGFARFERPDSRFDHAVIAWGGVIAQIIVAVPILIFLAVAGYTQFEAVNVVLAILGVYSLIIAAFNMLPIHPLDGSIAWGIIPGYLERRRAGLRRFR